MAVTTLDSLEKVAAPWRSTGSSSTQLEEEEEEGEQAPTPPEELPGKQANKLTSLLSPEKQYLPTGS